jgi:hypothetical protein
VTRRRAAAVVEANTRNLTANLSLAGWGSVTTSGRGRGTVAPWQPEAAVASATTDTGVCKSADEGLLTSGNSVTKVY